MQIKTYSLVFGQARMTQNAGYINVCVCAALYMELENIFTVKPKRDWCENVFSLWLHKSFEFWHVSGWKALIFLDVSAKKNWLPNSQNSIRLRTAPTIGSCRKVRTGQVSWMWNTLTWNKKGRRQGVPPSILPYMLLAKKSQHFLCTVHVYSKFNVYCKFVRFWHLHPNGMVTRLFWNAQMLQVLPVHRHIKRLNCWPRRFGARRCVGCSSHMNGVLGAGGGVKHF